MKILRFIIFNPTGLAIAAMHWIVVLFAMFGDNSEPHFGFNLPPSRTLLWDYLIWLNLPALSLNYLICTPIISVLQIHSWSNFAYSIVGIACISMQWLCVGAGLQFIVSEHNKGARQTLDVGGPIPFDE